MGFYEFNLYGSDLAFDSFWGLQKNIVSFLKKELEEPGNTYNTDGLDNVAFILDESIIYMFKKHEPSNEIIEFIESIINKLKVRVNDKKYSQYSYEYKKIINHLTRFISNRK